MIIQKEYVEQLRKQGATVYKDESVHVTHGASMNDFYDVEVVFKVMCNLGMKARTGSLQEEDRMLLQILATANIALLKENK